MRPANNQATSRIEFEFEFEIAVATRWINGRQVLQNFMNKSSFHSFFEQAKLEVK